MSVSVLVCLGVSWDHFGFILRQLLCLLVNMCSAFCFNVAIRMEPFTSFKTYNVFQNVECVYVFKALNELNMFNAIGTNQTDKSFNVFEAFDQCVCCV